MARKDIIRLKHIRIITYTLGCNLKRIFLSQLQKIGIWYYNQPKFIVLK